ncbi:MAG: hypothetical protein RR197_01250 [Oscillospiraceae bacterium]
MNRKRTLSLLLALVLTASLLGGCSGKNTTIAATYSGGELPAGIYLYELINASNEAYAKTNSADFLKKEIDGVKGTEWVIAQAKRSLQAFAAVETECTRLGITVAPEVEASLRASMERGWESDGATLSKNGISLDSMIAVGLNNQKRALLFDKYYGEGGEQAVSEQELKDYFAENFRRVLYLVVPKYDTATYQPLTGDALTARVAEIDGYYQRIQGGEPLFDLVVEYDKKQHETDTTHTHGELVESEQEAIIPKVSNDYPTLFLDAVFAATELNTVQRYDNGDLEILYEVRDLMGDGTYFEAAKGSLLKAKVGDAYQELLVSKADGIGLSINEAAIKRYQPDKLELS